MVEEVTKVVSDNTEQIISDDPKTTDTVSYETHKKLLAQRKADQMKMRELEEKLNGFVSEKTAAEEKKLVEQGEYKKLLDARNEELKSIQNERDQAFKLLTDTWKKEAVNKVLPGKLVRDEYYNFIDLDSIAFDPDTKQVDNSSVELVVNKFLTDHSALITKIDNRKLPASPSTTNYERPALSVKSNPLDIKNAIIEKLTNR